MQTKFFSDWQAQLATFVLAALSAASAGFWVLRFNEAPSSVLTQVVTTPDKPLDTSRVAQLLGASAPTTSASATSATGQFKLLGVIAQGTHGSALIAIDGASAKPYRVGDKLTDNLVLRSVQARSAALAPSLEVPATVILELPTLPSAQAAK